MLHKCFSILLLVCLFFSVSCQQNATQKPTTPAHSSSDWVDAEPQYDIEDYKFFRSEHIKDPYEELGEEEKFQHASSRFYRDFNQDGIPELCLQYKMGEEANSFVIYKINETDYSYISNIKFYSLEILTTNHYGFCDLLVFHKTGTLRGGNKEGHLDLFEYDGNQYIEKRTRKYVIMEELMSQKLFIPDLKINEELKANTGLGFIKDDDKYRKMIFDLYKKMFDIRIEINYTNEGSEEATIKYSGIILSIDWKGFKIGRATQEQFDALKKAGIAIYRKWEWKSVKKEDSEQSNKSKKLILVKNPYKDYWDIKEKKNNFRWFLARCYIDLNQDGIPEIFFPRYGGSGGSTYSLYQITKDGYIDLGSLAFINIQILPLKHNGFNDLMLYWHTSTEDGDLTIEEFDGFSYRTTKEMRVVYEQALNEKIFSPDRNGDWEQHPNSDKLLWSPKDDDKYRKLIK